MIDFVCILVNDQGFAFDAVENQVTVTSGQKAMLTCTFTSDVSDELSPISSYQLIWIRQSSASHAADSIIAHNQDLLIYDSRLSIQRTDHSYSLIIADVNVDDEGTYACEVNTQPPQKSLIQLYVQGKKH
jgi:hypothetical protein